MTIGYVRHVPDGTGEAAQAMAIVDHGADSLLKDQPGSRKVRQEILDGINEGNCILVGDIRAVADSVEDFRDVMDVLEERGAMLATADGNLTIDTRSEQGRTMVRILRTMAGMDAGAIPDTDTGGNGPLIRHVRSRICRTGLIFTHLSRMNPHTPENPGIWGFSFSLLCNTVRERKRARPAPPFFPSPYRISRNHGLGAGRIPCRGPHRHGRRCPTLLTSGSASRRPRPVHKASPRRTNRRRTPSHKACTGRMPRRSGRSQQPDRP